MSDEIVTMPCAVCRQGITLRRSASGAAALSIHDFSRDHAECLAELGAAGQLGETFEGRRRRLIREATRRAHDGPHGMLRTVSETEVEYLLAPLLSLLEDIEEQHAARPWRIDLSDVELRERERRDEHPA
jgi:hypothetical protein